MTPRCVRLAARRQNGEPVATVAIVASQISSKRRQATALAGGLERVGHRVILIDRPGAPEAPPHERVVLDLRPVLDVPLPVIRLLAEPRARRAAARSLRVDAVADLLVAERVDLAVVDIEEHEFTIAALASGVDVPLAVLSCFFELWPAVDVPPLSSPLPPDAGAVRVVRAWLRNWVGARRRELRRRGRGEGLDRYAVVRTCARQHGVRRSFTARQWLHPFAPRTIPVLSATAAELDLPHRAPAHVHRIGPLLDAEVSDPIGDGADLVEAADAARHDGRPVVLCVSGAFAAAGGPFLARLGEVARLRSDLVFFVATGDDDPGPLATLPNVWSRPWVPQRALLERTQVAIIHAGTGTLHECVAAGVPMVVYPLAADHTGNAVRVTHHGLGELGDRDDDPATIAARLDRVLADDAVHRRAAALGERVRRYARDDVAVATVEALLAG